jgi:hypothetical protein
VLREVGVDRLVHGSDRPFGTHGTAPTHRPVGTVHRVGARAEPPLGDAVLGALRRRNPSRLLFAA